jgi:hypothetical protein
MQFAAVAGGNKKVNQEIAGGSNATSVMQVQRQMEELKL